MRFIKRIPIISMLAVLSACSDVVINEVSDSAKLDAVEAAVVAIGSSIDDALASGGFKSYDTSLSCSRVGTCVSSTRSVTYACASADLRLKGTSKVVYTVNPASEVLAGTANCLWDSGETAAVTANTTFSGLTVGTLVRSTLNLPAYDATVVGGGAYLTRTGPSRLAITLSGMSFKNNLLNGTENFDVNVRSTADVVITSTGTDGSPRGDRIASSGTLEVFHNTKEFKATMVLTSVEWGSAGCCYPTGGSMAITYMGSITGAGSATFTGCGKVAIDGKIYSLRTCN